MDCEKVGKLILDLRKEKKLTQKQLADAMHISDKTISKWERGLGCPDISLLQQLSNVFSINMETLLLGDFEPNIADGGNMKKIKFYFCPTCGNVITATGEAEISCCGRKLAQLEAKPIDKLHFLNIEIMDEEYYLTFSHEMRKEHHLNFVAYVTCDRIHFVKLYPEQSGEVRFPRMRGGKFYFGCSQHGLWVQKG